MRRICVKSSHIVLIKGDNIRTHKWKVEVLIITKPISIDYIKYNEDIRKKTQVKDEVEAIYTNNIRWIGRIERLLRQ